MLIFQYFWTLETFLKIFFDKIVAILWEDICCFFYRVVKGLIVWLIKQHCSHLLVLISIVIHHLQVHDTEHTKLLVELIWGKSKNIHQKYSHCIIGINFSMIIYLICNNVHFLKKVLSINTYELNSYSL